MQKLVKDYLNELKKQRQRRRRAGIAIVLLAAIVITGVAGILTQYGIAMTGQVECGLKEHSHDASCYEQVLVCGLLEDGEGHVHGDSCYTTERILSCPETEGAGHTHGEECYETQEITALICALEEGAEHTHEDACYTTESTQALVCGLEETAPHVHSDACYSETRELSCTIAEGQSHVHSESCYGSVLTCEEEEHVHTDACYAADGTKSLEETIRELFENSTEETAEESEEETTAEETTENKNDWDQLYANTQWQDIWGEDLATAAAAQLGYEESATDYIEEADGSRRGYTRYGAFAGDEYKYAQWDAAFVNFCLYYAGLTETELFPAENDSAKWREAFLESQEENAGFLTTPEEYQPLKGDIVFFEEEKADGPDVRMGIVSSTDMEKNELSVLEGDSDNAVRENTYAINDEAIAGYVEITELEAFWKNIAQEMPKETEAETEDESEAALTEEELAQVEDVIALIEALPSPEEIMEKFMALEEAEDEAGYEAYYMALLKQVSEARAAYEALSEKQQALVTNAPKLQQYEWLESATLEENAPIWEVMKPDEAYVNEIAITSISTGTAPFDTQEGAGNDTTANDRIVRTFDTVTYNFFVNMKSWDISKSYSEARVKLEFVLPLSENEAVFEQTAMAWMDQTEGYKPVVTTETRTINGEEKECQVLTCYKLLLPSAGNQSVVPGNFGENVTINVLAMKNKQEFDMIFSAAMEGGAWDGACENENHTINGEPAIEKQSVTSEKVEVTAAPRYNIQLTENSTYKEIFNFQGDEAWMANYGGIAANTYIDTPIPGRMMKLGITIQLYNDNEAKGLKGIELPQGDIQFDIEVSSVYTINQPKPGTNFYQGQKIDTTNNYRPLLWSYGSIRWIEYGEWNTDGRPIYDTLGCIPLAPYSNAVNDWEKNACYRSGTWHATQDKDTGIIHVTISDYEIDVNRMPVINGDNAAGRYGANVGCFSSGAIWIVQPFNTIGGEGEDPYYEVVNTYGEGAFATTVKEGNMKTTTISGEVVQQGVNGFNQMVTNDDIGTRTLELTLPGALQNRVRYASSGEYRKYGSGVEDSRDGRDYAAIGSELYIMGGFSYNPRMEESNQLYLGTNLTKFYGSVIELQENNWEVDFTGGAALNGKSGNAAKENIWILYATKKDGRDWINDNELLNTYESDLVFYDSLEDIPKGHICVGVLYTFIGPGADPKASDPYYNCFYKAMVREDQKLVGDTFMLASTSRVWSKRIFEENDITLQDILAWRNGGTAQWASLWNRLKEINHYTSGNIEGSIYYTKETYRPDGSGIYGTHNSDWSHWGDTLLVIGYKTRISKYLLQRDNNGTEKQIFNLDADQRVVDFKLEPATYYDSPGKFNNTTTVTIVDTLPKYLSYRPGSSYFGGKYEPTSVNGGTQGNIVTDPDAGQFAEPVLTEPEVVKNADGTTTLTWKIPVTVGEAMAPIYYSVDIGAKGNPDQDVPIGTTNLENRVYITAPGDLRDIEATGEKHSQVGIAVTRGSASSFGKYAQEKVVDEDGVIQYCVYFNNNAETGTSLTIMDTMPMNGDNGSEFNGTYTFADWKLNTSKCDINKIMIYYTFDTSYRNKTTKEVTRDEIETWTRAQISSDGTIAIPQPVGEQQHPVAWAVIGTLDSGQSVNIDLKIQLKPEKSNAGKTNYFVNLLSSGDTTTTTETPTVRRTLEGLTWMDYDQDGLQGDPATETRVSGIKVELLKLKEGENPQNESSYENVYYPGTDTNNPDNRIVIETGQQISLRASGRGEATSYEAGRYKFTDLPAGTYAVRFSDGSTSIREWNAANVDCGTDDTRDSDGVASRTKDGILEKTTILNLVMPTAQEMSVSLFESKYHDSGFYPDTQMKLQKISMDGKLLTGAIFTIQSADGRNLSFIREEDGSYTPVDTEDTSRDGKYYIALAQNPYYVIGINGTGEGSLPILQNRTGSTAQLFEVRVRDGNLYNFLNVASNKWLDLDNGVLEEGAKVHVYSNQNPNLNQGWYFTKDQNGVGCIIPEKVGANGSWCLDLDAGRIEENRKIQLWSRNGTSAQQWLLIPAGNCGDTQTDLSVDSAGGLTINNMPPGDYTITEIKSPEGYAILREPVSFTVTGDGTIKTTANMAATQMDGSISILQVKNEKLYELPKTGGSGTFVYTISGTLLMMAGTLILYKKKMRGGAERVRR